MTGTASIGKGRGSAPQPEDSGKPEMRISHAEILIIKQLFEDNTPALKLMRKIFLPEYDASTPIGQTVDLWSVKDVGEMSPEDCKIYFSAREQLIKHVESQLMQLKNLAGMKVETAEEAAERAIKDSGK